MTELRPHTIAKNTLEKLLLECAEFAARHTVIVINIYYADHLHIAKIVYEVETVPALKDNYSFAGEYVAV